MEQRRERQRLEMQAGAAGAAGAADPSAVATSSRGDQLARLLKQQQRKNMDHARKKIQETVEMLRLLHCTALHFMQRVPDTACNGCLTAGKLWNVNGSLTFETSKRCSETSSCHQPRSGAG